jgi:O-antigen ligase
LVTERLGDISESGRFDIYTDALNKIEESPIFGSGLGSTITFNDEEVQAHNIFLTAWMSAGILGLAFSLLYYGKILYDVYLLWRRKDAWRLPTPIGWVIAFTMLPIVRVLVSGQGDFTLVEWFCMAYFYSALYVNSKVVAQEQASLEAEAATAMPAVAP